MASTKKRNQSSRPRKRRRKKSGDWVTNLFLKVIAIIILVGAMSAVQQSAQRTSNDLNESIGTSRFVESSPAYLPAQSDLADFDIRSNHLQPEFELGQNVSDPGFQRWR